MRSGSWMESGSGTEDGCGMGYRTGWDTGWNKDEGWGSPGKKMNRRMGCGDGWGLGIRKARTFDRNYRGKGGPGKLKSVLIGEWMAGEQGATPHFYIRNNFF